MDLCESFDPPIANVSISCLGNRHTRVAPFCIPILRCGVDHDRIPRRASVCSGLATLAHARCAPPTTAIHTLEISCTRVRSFPTRSRLDNRASTRSSAPAEVLRLCTDTIEEPSVSRRQARFSEPVQPARDCSSLAVRCEPTSDAPVAFAPRFAFRFCFPEKCANRVAGPSLRLPASVKSTGRVQAQDIFHRKAPLLDARSLDRAPCMWMPARTTIHNQPS